MTNHPSIKDNSTTNEVTLIERMVERENMMKAYKKVMANKGAAGIDNMTVDAYSGLNRPPNPIQIVQ